jgi:GDP-D-mannose dehydratase
LKPNSLNNHKVFFTKNLKGKQNILNGRVSVEIEPAFYRPVKANFLVGDPSKMKIISDGKDKAAGKVLVEVDPNTTVLQIALKNISIY